MPSPLGTWALALENIRRRPFRSAGLAMVVAIFALTLFGGSMFAQNIRNGIDVMSQRLGADILVVPSAYDQNLEGALLRGEPSTFYLDAALTGEIQNLPGVARASPQLFIASLNAECCTVPVQLIGYEQRSDFIITPWLAAQRTQPLAEDEVVAGAYILAKPGDTLTFFNHPVRVVAVLEKTGMGFDSSVFMDMVTARRLMASASEVAALQVGADAEAAEKVQSKASTGMSTGLSAASISSVMVRVVEGADVNKVAYDILKSFANRFDVRAIIAKNMMRDIADKLRNLAWLIYGLAAVFWLIALGVLTIIFSISFNERKREFSILRILGATRRKLVVLVLCESLMVSVLGALAGIVLATLIVFPFNTWIGSHVGLPYLQPAWGVIAAMALGSFLLATLVGPLACSTMAWRIGRLEVYSAMREAE